MQTPNSNVFIISALVCLLATSMAKIVEAAEQQQQQQQVGRPHSHTLEIIGARGFGGEEYHIRSYDGYPLTVYHVINPYAEPARLNKYPVIVFHGLGGDATQMISHSTKSRARRPPLDQPKQQQQQQQLKAGPGDECLAFMLANNNYDVWLVDARGVNLNNRNITDDTDFIKSQRFWRYSLDEQALNDAPKQVDFVLEQTRAPKALLVTYSESTFFLFALLAAAPDYADKIAGLAALAPAVYVAHMRGFAVPAMVPFLLVPEGLEGNYAPQPVVDTVGTAVRRLCGVQLIALAICNQVAQGITGKMESPIEGADFFTTLMKSASIRVFKHFVQLNLQNRFGMYDYGPQMNLIKYKQPAPPNYELGRVKLATIILARGGNDFLSTELDQERLIRELGVKLYKDIRLPHYNHLDFLLNRNVVNDVNVPILAAFAEILLSEPGHTMLRQPASFTRPQTPSRKPDFVVAPEAAQNRQAGGSGGLIYSPIHVFRNMINGLDLNSKLGFLSEGGGGGGKQTAASPMNLIAGLEKMGEQFDQLTGSSLNSFPYFIQPPPPPPAAQAPAL